ncbi:uncharacterized protein LOC134684660 [Mytilus trossulus]|uniref:uncharacterized protein LOC134684660 n=1 Tax=Mytilus trossulus TaxID=6551 RepID=UPI003006AF1B
MSKNVKNEPNHTTVLYDLIDSADSNTFSMLSISNESKSSSINQDDSNISIGDPIASSSPKRVKQTKTGNKNKKALRTLIINFQSIKNKRTELPILIETANPDIIIGTETWLSNKIGNREFFPPELGYDIVRRDHEKDPHCGVLIAAKNELEMSQVSISKEAEMITGKIKIGTKQYIITSFYRPPNKTDSTYVEKTITEIQNLRNNNKRSTFLLGGDFNLPDISWERNEIKGNQLPESINRAFLQMSADLSIQQINNNTTRGKNILDLMFTGHPGHIERYKTLPPIGNSDHDIVLVDISANVNKPKPPKRKIYLWKKDLESIGKYLESQFDTFKKTNFDDINNMWTSIKHIILKDSMEKYVPTKTSLARQSHPWMNTQLRRLSKQKQRAYSKAKLTNSTKDWKQYINIKAELQRESTRAHTKFMQNIVSDELYKNPKRFWSYIKSRKQESSGITSLKKRWIPTQRHTHKSCYTKHSIPLSIHPRRHKQHAR